MRPSAEALLETLAILTSAPPSWEPSDTEDTTEGSTRLGKRKKTTSKAPQINPEGITRYLTSIVSSDLRWIQDEEAKEEIWNQASFRLSERSGRTAMGALSRTFRIPSPEGHIELSIHEPGLTGDDLGLKTWAASYLLAKRLPTFKLIQPRCDHKLQVLELGSGTGLVGLAMASLGADVVLTDLPSIHTNLARNLRDNDEIVRQRNGSTKSGILDWTEPTSCQLFLHEEPETNKSHIMLDTKFPVIVAADSLYSPEHPRWLVNTIATWLAEDKEAKVIIEFPLRDPYLPEIQDFRERMSNIGLIVLGEGYEVGYDDWGCYGANEEEDDSTLVKCGWSCWGRSPTE
jgi:predicted nicotinamide N-methyase